MYKNDNMTAEYKKRTHCAVCSNDDLVKIMDYGDVPLAGDFPAKKQLGNEQKYPLGILFCPKCTLVQIDGIVEPDRLFKDYRYLSSPGLSGHFKSLAEKIVQEFNLNSESKVLDIGANDGVLLKPLMTMGINSIGIDPAENVSKIAREAGCNIITGYFNDITAKECFGDVKFDIVTCSNCFAHINNIDSIVRGVNHVLKPDGTFIIEVHYLKNLITHLQYDNVYIEHIFMWSLTALRELFLKHGMYIYAHEEIPVHAGSIRVFVAKLPPYPEGISISKSFTDALKEERNLGIVDLSGLQTFSDRTKTHINSVKSLVQNLKLSGNKIVGYGASGRANMLSHLCDFTPDDINYIVDESPERAGRYLARTHIPIVNKSVLDNDEKKPDYVFIFAWNFAKMIIEKLDGKNYKFIIPFPEPRIVENAESLDLALTL